MSEAMSGSPSAIASVRAFGRCHGRACPGHPRPRLVAAGRTWIPGTRPGMTEKTKGGFRSASTVGSPDERSDIRGRCRNDDPKTNRIGGLHPSHLWGGWHRVSGANEVSGGGASASEVLAHGNELPPPGASRHPPHKWEG